MKLLVALVGLLMLVSCQQEEEYVVRDLTTLKSPWIHPDYSYPDSASWYWEGELFRSMFNEFIESHQINSLKEVKKDTTALAFYIFSSQNYWQTQRGFRLVLSSSGTKQKCEYLELVEKSELIDSTHHSERNHQLKHEVQLQGNQTSEYFEWLESEDVWKQHSFINETHSGHSATMFVEIREGNRYKLFLSDQSWPLVVLDLLASTRVYDKGMNGIRNRILKGGFNPDTLSRRTLFHKKARSVHNIEQGYFDTDSTWLVE
ncbi:MAG: hypothetical protein HWE14_05150 [Flavobacteriia bacterium]|nr:hypothetical protein [Flavobacteriia bacterium]